MKARIFFAIALAAVAFSAADITAQETAQPQQPAAETAAVQQPPAEQPAAEKKPEVKPSEAAKPSQAAASSAQKAPAPAAVSADADALALLETSDGDFRSERIPGMTFEKKKILTAGETAAEDKTKDAKPSSSGKGGWVVKIVLALILIFIFLLYRFNKHGKRRKVLRRFPK